MIHINLMGNQKHFDQFCAAMDKMFSCRAPHCDKTCWAQALKDVQITCNEKSVSINEAARKWAETGLTHKDGEDILKDVLGVKSMGAVRKSLSGETT